MNSNNMTRKCVAACLGWWSGRGLKGLVGGGGELSFYVENRRSCLFFFALGQVSVKKWP